MLVIITGRYNVPQDDVNLVAAIKRVWNGKLFDKHWLFARWDDKPLSRVLSEPKKPGEQLGILGFSFGGEAAVELAQALGSFPVDLLGLVDPVNYHDWAHPSAGFTVPSNVRNAFCFHRASQFVTGIPWSGYIRQVAVPAAGNLWTSGHVSNYAYTPKPGTSIDAQHGQYMWEKATWDAINAVLKG